MTDTIFCLSRRVRSSLGSTVVLSPDYSQLFPTGQRSEPFYPVNFLAQMAGSAEPTTLTKKTFPSHVKTWEG